MTGKTLSHYRIDAELGRGGMGIVYRATDTKLDRTVALKVLPAHALSSDEDKARFYREAKAAAQLHHPNIATVFEISEAIPSDAPHGTEPRPFIAMEFIDGEMLESRIKRGPLPLAEVVRIASEIAEALGAAHEAGVVHRDIKSANVMLTAKSVVKVLDFGLAKTAASTQLTRQGSTMGTMAYMSPEQARGEEVDRRTDLWALGIILYEMVAGRLPFAADYEQAAVYGILNEDPTPLTAIRTDVPMGLEWIVSKLLAKPVQNRYQSAEDLLVDLRTVDLGSQTLSRVSQVSMAPTPASSTKRNPLDLTGRMHPAAIVGLALLAAVFGWWLGRDSTEEAPARTVKRVVQSVPLGGLVAAMDISEDGRYIAIGTEDIHVLDLSRNEQRSYNVSDVFVHLAFSPDGERLLITTASGLKILTLDSGSVIEIVTTREGGPRAEWLDAETILHEDLPSIYERSLTTGAVRQVIPLDTLAGEFDMDYPMMLPDGKTVVATAQSRNAPDRIGFWDLESGNNKGYIDLPGLRVQYVETGHLIFVLNGDLVAMPFDLDNLEQTGPLIPLDKNVRAEGATVSSEGTLAHAGNQVGIATDARPVRPVSISMTDGSFSNDFPQSTFPAALYRNASVHPDGSMAAIVVAGEPRVDGPTDSDIWILDFRTGSRRAFTTGGTSFSPAWSPTGDSLYFVRRLLSSQRSIMVKATSGRGGEHKVFETGNTEFADLAISPTGNQAVASVGIPNTMDAASRFRVFDFSDLSASAFRSSAESRSAPGGNPRKFDFSPDGRYLAYEDQGAIRVQSTEDYESAPYLIWENGMTLPRWSPDGTVLYALNVEGGGQGVPVELDPVFSTVGPPEDFGSQWYAFGTGIFDVFPDGNRFLFSIADGEAAATVGVAPGSFDLHLVFNLTAELQGR